MRRKAITTKGYGSRISAVEALLAATDARSARSSALRLAADDMDEAGPDFESRHAQLSYSAFAELLRICAHIVEWRAAVLDAGVDADRFLRGAKAKLALWIEEFQNKPIAEGLLNLSSEIDALSDTGQVTSLLQKMANTSLPLGVVKTEYRTRLPPGGLSAAMGGLIREREPKPEPKADLNVAFLKFSLNGSPASETHFLAPGQAHDVDIEVRVSRWPEGAEVLELRPLSIDPPGTHDFPTFQIPRPSGDPPYILKDRGRGLLKVGQHLQARPFEFRYSAHFLPDTTEQPVIVVGQRNLRIESVDLKQHSLTGYPHLDSKLIELRNFIRARPMVAPEDLVSAFVLLAPLANFAGQCLQDNRISDQWSEQRFQTELQAELRRSPSIGAELLSHAHAGGGITDLSFRGIPLELKAVSNAAITLADCQKYVPQTVSYVVASGKRIGILCVLDSTPKIAAAVAAEDCIEVVLAGRTESPICIIVVLIQANLARPSALSR